MKKPILPVWRLFRPLAPALLVLAAFIACAQLKNAFVAAPHPWPPSRDHRVRKDGLRLRAYGGSFSSPALAAQDAKEALKRYLLTLDVPGEGAQRSQTIEKTLRSFAAVPTRAAAKEGHAAVIDVELSTLQKLLGTPYD